jgi:glycosyltransferase involved in cell wall biosynthesis
VYVQYTNPAAYPPLIHSSRILASRGWRVLFLGTGSEGSGELRLENDASIRIAELPFARPGLRQKLHFLYFHLWCLAHVLAFRPSWIYCSDLFASPFGWLMSLAGMRVVYHEHDSPGGSARGAFERCLLWTRAACARRVVCVIPNARRGECLRHESGAAHLPALVWNCPRMEEVTSAREPLEPGSLRLLYHGSVVPERLPLGVIDALARVPGKISLTIVGYETNGSKGYLDRLRERAAELRISDRLHIVGALSRDELMQTCRNFDAGLALMPRNSDDRNLGMMEGASNKPFDYLACGLALVVSRIPEWEAMFVEPQGEPGVAPGYAYACDPASPGDLAAVFTQLIQDPIRTRAMGEAGRRRVLSEWNYEHQFQPVLEILEGRMSEAAIAGARAMEARG